MSTSTLTKPTRSQVEAFVRSFVQKQWAAAWSANGHTAANGLAATKTAPNVVVNISARHCHVTQPTSRFSSRERGTASPRCARLYQNTNFAANETVAVVGPRQRMIPSVRTSARAASSPRCGTRLHGCDQSGDRSAGAALGRHRGHAGLPLDRAEGEPCPRSGSDPGRAPRSHGPAQTKSITGSSTSIE